MYIFFLHWRYYSTINTELMNDVKEIDENILNHSANLLVQLLLLSWCKIQIDWKWKNSSGQNLVDASEPTETYLFIYAFTFTLK